MTDTDRDIPFSTAESNHDSDFKHAQAHWLTRDTIAWNVSGEAAEYTLHVAPRGGLRLTHEGVVGGTAVALAYDQGGLSDSLKARHPHLAGYHCLRLAPEAVARVPELLKGQVVISARGRAGELIDATGLQIPGVLDDLFAFDGELGVSYQGFLPRLSVWAPTAISVQLHLFPNAHPETLGHVHPMHYDPHTGVWSITGAPDWDGQFYLYEVEVFVRQTGRVERNLVTDPYSVSLAMNSTRSQIINLNDSAYKPSGWEEISKPPLDAFSDIVLYELHVRDFSIFDETVRPEYRGTYMAFTERDSQGMRHLRTLADAGLTHIHLLPVFDIATINEDQSKRTEPDLALLSSFPPDSHEQANIVHALREQDGFNWGYDPYHYTTPEGSYATHADGPMRVREFREMVQALNAHGLRVVMDVVYNHTHASGQNHGSVLDKVVPGYYHRLCRSGNVENSTCCANTATEHTMMFKLMRDSVVTWAKQYKIDGFRFDLMGHHMKADMVRLREALDSLTLEADGVDGTKIYIYGEGWDFGEVAYNARGVNASQGNMAGTGIGTFNDRLRDALRGGWPFDSGDQLVRRQGLATGLFFAPNVLNRADQEERNQWLRYSDHVRVGLAGNLRDVELEDHSGRLAKGSDIDYGGQPTGYAHDPHETVNYVEAHDNQTLFDIIQYKAPHDLPMDARVRMYNLANTIVMLSQGVPFFHAGQDMLRSKSLDRDSFNSGDWFNRLDFTYHTNNWGVGLPPSENETDVPIQRALLGNPALKPIQQHIRAAAAHFQELLRIRKSSPLLRLRTRADVLQRVRMHNTGPRQTLGLLATSIEDRLDTPLDSAYQLVVVLFNFSPDTLSLAEPRFTGLDLVLHPVLHESHDLVVRESRFDSATGTFFIPNRTAAVFVLPRERY